MRHWIVITLTALLVAGCANRDNAGYKGSTPSRTTPTTELSSALPTEAPPGPAIGADTDGNAPGIPELYGTIETTASGLRYIDEVVGGGSRLSMHPEPGMNVSVHYTGWLTNGTKFDSSRDKGQPFVFRIGMGQVILGWDEGVASMGLSGKRRLIVPPSLGYGPLGTQGIPPNSTLIFDVELLGMAQ